MPVKMGANDLIGLTLEDIPGAAATPERIREAMWRERMSRGLGSGLAQGTGSIREMTPTESFLAFSRPGRILGGIGSGASNLAQGILQTGAEAVLTLGDAIGYGMQGADNALGGNLAHQPRSAIGQSISSQGMVVTALDVAGTLMHGTVTGLLSPIKALARTDDGRYLALGESLPGLVMMASPLLRGVVADSSNTVSIVIERDATSYLGRAGNELKNAPYQKVRNENTQINGTQFSGHALDQMQNRGVMPSVVEHALQIGTPFRTRGGTTGFYDAVNRVRVIVNTDTGKVVTVIRGEP
jgi:hypothetical protein